jgi:hypothetical protein
MESKLAAKRSRYWDQRGSSEEGLHSQQEPASTLAESAALISN